LGDGKILAESCISGRINRFETEITGRQEVSAKYDSYSIHTTIANYSNALEVA
jgi:hypothetical protein